jgi:hypothetical protein
MGIERPEVLHEACVSLEDDRRHESAWDHDRNPLGRALVSQNAQQN